MNFTNNKGSIKVTGYNGDVILITGVTRFPVESASKISENEIFSADEKNNRITIFRSEPNRTIDFDLKIPRNFSMRVSSLDNGTIEIININGDIEASNPAGDIILENIAGSAVVSTVSGKKSLQLNLKDVKASRIPD